MRNDLERLCAVAEAAYHNEAEKLRQIRSDETALMSEARALRRADHGSEMPLLVAAAAAEPWRRWRDLRLREIERQRAALRAEREGVLASTRRAFGRHQVLSELASRSGKR